MTADRFACPSEQFACPSEQRPQDFLTITDEFGGSINFERDADGAVQVWIAQPGENDGYSVYVGMLDARRIADYFRSAA